MTVFQGILGAAFVLLALAVFVRNREGRSSREFAIAAAATALALVFSLIWDNPRTVNRNYDGDDRSPAERVAERRDERRYDAFRAYQEKKYDRAVAICGEILRSSPRDAQILEYRAFSLLQLGNSEAALEDYRSLIALQPGNIKAVQNADRILAREKRWDEILPLWNEYLRAVPNDAEAHFERGGTYFHKGDLESARADARKACELGLERACRNVKYLDARIGP